MSNVIGQTIEQISKEKNIDSQVIISALEDAMAAAARKFYKSGEDLHARFDLKTGQIEVFSVLKVVKTVENPSLEISIENAHEYDETIEIDDTVEMPKSTEVLGRIAAQTAKQVILQKVREAERHNVFDEYSGKIGEMVNGIVKRHEGPDIIVDIGKIEASLPLKEQSHIEKYKQGDRIRAVITRVLEMAKGPQVIISRIDSTLLNRLFEMEIPEIYDGTIVIKSAVHEPGDRAKIAVASMDRDVDPVGACVGMKGTRINNIIRELRGEKIDIVQWSEDPAQYAANALNPAKISKVLVLDPVAKHMEVIVDDKQQSLAIGKKGQNVRLASKLIGWQIDVKNEEQKKREVMRAMESLTSSVTPLSEMEGISDDVIMKIREIGIESVERILELGEETFKKISDLSDEIAAEVMVAARDMFEEVEIEVPEGVNVPTAIAGLEISIEKTRVDNSEETAAAAVSKPDAADTETAAADGENSEIPEVIA